MGNNPKVIDLRILLTISKWIFNDNFLQCPNLRMFNDNVDNFHGVKAFKAKVCFCNPTQLVHKNMTVQLYVCPREMFHNCLENCCRHVQALGGNHLTAGDIWSNRRQFLEQAARKCGNFWSKRREKEAICFGKYWSSIDFQLLDTAVYRELTKMKMFEIQQ